MPVERYPVHMRSPIPTISCVLITLLCVGCESVSFQSTQHGKDTWRSKQLQLDADGGTIHLSVRERADEPITVLLLVDNTLDPGEESPRKAKPYAAARGVPTNGILRLSFSQLPIASYYVVAFLDRNDDGQLEESWPPNVVKLDFVEPHSELQHFHIRDSKHINLALDIRD